MDAKLTKQHCYRPDIDGLRAVAVLLVMLFHAGLGFAGGFVGVDVFFVISGFLITGIIVRELDAGTFQFTRFWGRRMRRILPAASLVVVAALVAGYLLLIPRDFYALAQSAFAQQGMAANVYFCLATDYFDGRSDEFPLLHMWSLAVEEQFYLIFPFLLVGLHRFGKKVMLAAGGLLMLLSFVYAIVEMRISPTSGFFLLPGRAWEFLLGGLLAVVPVPTATAANPTAKPGLRWELLSLVGLLSIVVCAVGYDMNTEFPGITALPPCLGAAALIYANTGRLTFIGRCLSFRPMVAVGLVSYSLYLWHWPVLAFLRIESHGEMSLATRMFGLALGCLLAVLAWRLVEQPVRVGFSRARFYPTLATAVASVVVIAGTALVVLLQHGLPGRLPDAAARLAADQRVDKHYMGQVDAVAQGDLPLLGNSTDESLEPHFVVWGDSHALALAEMFDALAEQHHLSGRMAARAGNPGLLGASMPLAKRRNQSHRLGDWNHEVLDYIDRHAVKHVVLVSRWTDYIHGNLDGRNRSLITDAAADEVTAESARQVLARSLNETVDQLCRRGARVYIVKQVPSLGFDPEREAGLAKWRGDSLPLGPSLAEHENFRREANRIIDQVVAAHDAAIALDPSSSFFEGQQRVAIADEHGVFFSDATHVSAYGASKFVTAELDRVFVEMASAETRILR